MSKKNVKAPKERGNGFLYGIIVFLVLFFVGGAIYTSQKSDSKIDENATEYNQTNYNKEETSNIDQNKKKDANSNNNKDKGENQQESENTPDTSKIETTLAPTTKKEIKIKVTIDTLKVRSEPSENGEIVTLVDEDDVFTVIKKKGDWYQISTGSGTGYVKAEFVEEVK